MDVTEWTEWRAQLQELLELNPDKYREVQAILADIVVAERRLASQDLRVMLGILRSRFYLLNPH